MTAFTFPWPQWESRLLALIGAGKNATEASAILTEESGIAVYRSAVGARARKLGTPFPRPELPSHIAEQIEALWQEGLSITKIGKQLKISRDSVVGKAHRLGLPGREPRKNPLSKAEPRSPRKRVYAPKPRQAASASVIDLPDPSKYRSILDLNDIPEAAKLCRWIVGDVRKPLDPIYCGARTFSGCYCHEHWERSLTPEGRARMAAKMKQAA